MFGPLDGFCIVRGVRSANFPAEYGEVVSGIGVLQHGGFWIIPQLEAGTATLPA